MIGKVNLFVVVFLLIGVVSSAQELLDIDIRNRCIYHGTQMDEELYSFSPESKEMESRIRKILELGGDLKINFYIVETNVQNVSAVVDGNKRFLLWSQDFFLNASEIERVGITAHEMAHHLNEHTLTEDRKEKEEAEADFFMGFVLAKTKFNESDIKALVQKMPLAGDAGFNQKRYDQILLGYKKGKAGLTADSAGWEGSSASLDNFKNAQFPFPPPECHTAYEIPNQYFGGCYNLGDVSKKISKCLHKKQYPYRYMSVPNGFVIVTQMEQYHPDGNIMKGSPYRWVDYPPQESFAFSWNYIKSLIYPKKGYLRLFVFIITNENYSSDKKQVSKEEARSWLSQGVNRLPKDVASQIFNADYAVSFLTYEFEVPESNHQVRQSCPCNHQASEHFRKTGMEQELKR